MILMQAALLITAGALRGQYLSGYDGIGHYVWIRSLVCDGDVDFRNDFRMYDPHGSGPDPTILYPATGLAYNHYPAIPALLNAPGFLLGRAVTLMGPDSWRQDGFGWPEQLGYALNALAWFAGGLVMLYLFLASQFHWKAALALTAVAAFGSAPGVAAWNEPFFAHSIEFFLVVGLLRWSYGNPYRRHEIPGPSSQSKALLGGLLAGLLVSVRPMDALLLLIPIGSSLRFKVREGKTHSALSPLVMGFLLSFLPHLALRFCISGEWNPLGGYKGSMIVHGGTFSNWMGPNIDKVLLATNNGLIFWCPVLVLGLLGLFRFARERDFWLPSSVILYLYMIGSWEAWDGSASMGPRLLSGLTPLLLWTAGLDGKQGPRYSRALVPLSLFTCLWFNGLVLQRFTHQLPYYENFARVWEYPYMRTLCLQWSNTLDLVRDPAGLFHKLAPTDRN